MKKDPAKSLDKKQCIAALEIFNNYQHAERNLQIIWPVLPEVLQSVILGMSEVEQYFSYRGQKLELPKDIAEQRYIYLRARLEYLLTTDTSISILVFKYQYSNTHEY
jgi:hypothetical protein